ncbi:MAG: FCD domain-containing protein [Micromonosporaceae bacterium]|nr:FCD domain-containing protein [Micromonosporaceae bacterium]
MTASLQHPDNRVPQRTLADSATSALHDAILTGELSGGAPLRLGELASLLGMSMMPVREALRRLAAIGLVEIIPHKGAWVRELSAEDAQDTLDTRIALETLAIQRAAQQFTEQNAQTAAAELERHVSAARRGDNVAARLAHTQFHFTIYQASGSRWLLRALEPVWQNSERYRFAGPRRSSLPASTREHQAILDACVAHDSEAAVATLVNHLRRSHERIVKNMSASGRAKS